MSYEASTQGNEPPLDWPYHGIGFGAPIERHLGKYGTFSSTTPAAPGGTACSGSPWSVRSP